MTQYPELCIQILKGIQHLAKISKYTKECIECEKDDFDVLASAIIDILSGLSDSVRLLVEEDVSLGVHLFIENAHESFLRICRLISNDRNKAIKKMEFEFIPTIEEMYVDVFFFCLVHPDKEKILHYYENDMLQLCSLFRIEEAEQRREYKYELSIGIPAYNHIEATKLCVSSLLDNIPKGLKYELILFNHGSSDGTKEYFEEINPTKQVDFIHNVKSFGLMSRLIEGKYFLFISNDVIITPKAIENLMICIKSSDDIGMAAPTSPNISNLQTIPAEYSNLQELNEFAVRNNVSDPFRWEERVRLTPPMCIFPSKILCAHSFMGYGYLHQSRGIAFGDDRTSMLLRRNGYKNILCKDAYVHHIGSITINEDIAKEKNDVYALGRRNYERIFEIDPWGTGFCYSSSLMDALNPLNKTYTNILGINCGMGENSLHIRERIKQNMHNTNVRLYNITTDNRFLLDLKAISDEVEFISSLEVAIDSFKNVLFDYIVLEDNLGLSIQPSELVKSLYERLSRNGKLAICIENKVNGMSVRYMEETLKREHNGDIVQGSDGMRWFIIMKLDKNLN